MSSRNTNAANDSTADETDWDIVSRDDLNKSTNNGFFFNLSVRIRNRPACRLEPTCQHQYPHDCCVHGHVSGTQPSPGRPQIASPRKAMSAQEQSKLFTVPPEIRLQIYEALLCIPAPEAGVRLICKTDTPSVLTILQTCQRALDEAETIFYSLNRLHVDDSDHLASLGAKRRDAIRKLTLPALKGETTLNVVSRLQRFSNLESLYLQREMSIKFTNVKNWAIMSHQIAAEVQKYEGLKEIRFLMPEAKDLTAGDLERERKLQEIDMRIQNALSK